MASGRRSEMGSALRVATGMREFGDSISGFDNDGLNREELAEVCEQCAAIASALNIGNFIICLSFWLDIMAGYYELSSQKLKNFRKKLIN